MGVFLQILLLIPKVIFIILVHPERKVPKTRFSCNVGFERNTIIRNILYQLSFTVEPIFEKWIIKFKRLIFHKIAICQ